MPVRQALSRFTLATMCLAVRTPSVLDPHFDALRQTWVGVPQLRPPGECRGETLPGNAAHVGNKVAHLFCF